MSKSVWMVALLLAATATAGCTTAAKEGLGVVRGASGVYAPIQPAAPAADAHPLAEYTNFELGTFTDDFGGKVPTDLMMYARAEFSKQLAGKKLPDNPGGKTLVIRGRILHYESADTLGMAIGPLEEVIARAEMVDKETGNVLGVANVVGRTTVRVNLGVEKKGQGLAKAIVEWIDSLYPPRGQ